MHLKVLNVALFTFSSTEQFLYLFIYEEYKIEDSHILTRFLI